MTTDRATTLLNTTVKKNRRRGLGYLDYGARMYDASLGRWFGVDPAGELAPHLSSYRYALNNPVNYVDLYGLWESTSNGWFTNDFADISRFLDMMKLEENQYGYVSDAQMDKFISEEYHGTGGKLSNGSLLLSCINAYKNSAGFWQIPPYEISGMMKEIAYFGSLWMNQNNMVSSWSFYSYKYYREKQWKLSGGSFPGIAIGSYITGSTANWISNSRTWLDLQKMKFYSQKYNGNQYRTFASVGRSKRLTKIFSGGLNLVGKGLGVLGAIATANEYRSGKLTDFGVSYMGGSDILGLSKSSLGAAWSIGTNIGKWIVESNYYFNLMHNNRVW